MFKKEYLKELKDRAKHSRIYKKHQLIGLELATILEDDAHKALYIKLAREYPADRLLELAKTVVDGKKIANKGAYFMSRFADEKKKWRRVSI